MVVCVRHQKVGCFCKQDDLFRRAADLCAPGDLSRPPPDLCRPHHGICGGQKIGAFQQILAAQEGGLALCREFAHSSAISSSRCPDIDEIRWQNSSGADSRLIVPLPRATALFRGRSHTYICHIYLSSHMKMHKK